MDDAAELVSHLEPGEIEPILAQLPAVDAREVRELLAYPDGSAGRMMTEKFAAIRRDMTVAQTRVGTVIPLLSKKAGYDPALTAGPFETAFQDVVGISIFLAFATLMMPLLR